MLSVLAMTLLAAPKLHDPIVGRSIQIDPGFPYYQNRSKESVAREIEVNGYGIVRYVAGDLRDVDDGLIDALHKRGIAVWCQTFGNGFYGKGEFMPKGWENWKQVMLGKDDGGDFNFLSLNHPGFIAWKKAELAKVMREHKFDGIEVAEPFQMGWLGPDQPCYGDFSEVALKAFREETGCPEPPEFKDPSSPRYYKTDRQLYGKWVDYRVHVVSNYLKELVDVVRKSAPGKPFACWALANTAPKADQNPVELAREWQGIDAAEMARVSKPDLICFQTNWPDWSTPALPGAYPLLYKPFVDQLRKDGSKVPFIVQADFGSLEPMRRSRAWIAQFEKACKDIGAVGSTAYMYDLALWMYTEAPQLRAVEAKGDSVLLVFQKRLDPKTVKKEAFAFSPTLLVKTVKCDGNLVRLKVKALKAGAKYKVTATGVSDDPSTWLFKGKPANNGGGTMNFRASKR